MLQDQQLPKELFDLGHQGPVDVTQIDKLLRMTPTERLRHHERWRRFLKEVVARAKLLREVAGVRVKVLPLDLLIKTKRAAGRPKDLAVLPLLEEARNRQDTSHAE